MKRKSVTTLTERQLGLQVLSKILYFLAGRTPYAEEVKRLHRKFLKEDFQTEDMTDTDSQNSDSPEMPLLRDVPWYRIFDSVADSYPLIKRFRDSGRFTDNEIRYMSSLLCGLSGAEFGLISGHRSHYNLGWSIRKKLELPPKQTNLRLALKTLLETNYSGDTK